MIEHLQNGAVQCNGGIGRPCGESCGRDTKDDEAHMVYGRIGDEAFKIRLGIRGKCTEDDCSRCEESECTCEIFRFHRIEWENKAQETIRAKLQQNTSKDHRASGRCLRVG